MQNLKRGFTLIELLIVIGILAILVAAVVVVLNPAQLLAQARDGQRMSDMDSIRSAVNLYLATVDAAALTTTSTYTVAGTATPTGWTGALVVASTAVDGTGWVKVALNQVSGGSPISKLPTDPTNLGSYYYGYKATSTASTFKLIGRLESVKYQGKMTTDGGTLNTCTNFTEATCFYEIGSDVTGL
ncbi:MAG: prepilin-type N-terminal cleavage/methylation domain-containing protein [Candidatus Paceibacterota bacterium]|jgi:prepilin-type N-terminal cleavage/methylation domain-containing protein